MINLRYKCRTSLEKIKECVSSIASSNKLKTTTYTYYLGNGKNNDKKVYKERVIFYKKRFFKSRELLNIDIYPREPIEVEIIGNNKLTEIFKDQIKEYIL